jgi:DNA polymerase I-like protein with 3'-5' exonuclease and polymerase domains
MNDAFNYGAGDAKLGSIVQGTATDGAELRAKFLDSLPKLGKLINRVKRASGKGYLSGLDSRKIMMRKGDDGRVMRHKALNTLLQGAGAIVMKRSCILLWEEVAKTDITAYKVLDMHDEGQSEVLIKDIELYSQLAVQSIMNSGKHYKLNIPLAAEAMVGNNLAETH